MLNNLQYLQLETSTAKKEANAMLEAEKTRKQELEDKRIEELKNQLREEDAIRKQAEKALGSQFDIRDFHYHVLANGAVPLNVLEQNIRNYIQSVLSNEKTIEFASFLITLKSSESMPSAFLISSSNRCCLTLYSSSISTRPPSCSKFFRNISESLRL